MAITPNFNPTISQCAGNKAATVITKENKDTEVAGG